MKHRVAELTSPAGRRARGSQQPEGPPGSNDGGARTLPAGQEPEIPMALLAEAGAAPQTAHAEAASRADVAPERLRAVLARLCDGRSSAAAWLRVARGRVAARLTATCWRRPVCFAAPPLALLLLPAMGLAYHVFFDRSGLPDIEPFNLPPSTTGSSPCPPPPRQRHSNAYVPNRRKDRLDTCCSRAF
jgi:hypothetical protein